MERERESENEEVHGLTTAVINVLSLFYLYRWLFGSRLSLLLNIKLQEGPFNEKEEELTQNTG